MRYLEKVPKEKLRQKYKNDRELHYLALLKGEKQ